MTDNMTIWDALSKTDPSQTKPFSRSGGFKGTAVKPIWITKRLTEQFGAIGVGWGVFKPTFQVIPAGDEILVYCWVECWHTKPENTFYGVGGDKVASKRQSGIFADDEAFKKAFTDAVGNAFKFTGVSADVHMGLFDDSKYVAAMEKEFETKPAMIDSGQISDLQGKIEGYGLNLGKILQHYKIKQLTEIPAEEFANVTRQLNLWNDAKIKKQQEQQT